MQNVNFKSGDIVQISGAYFKSQNGLFFVERGEDYPNSRGGDIWLRRIKKNGELTADGAKSCESWPLRSYCSDKTKNFEAHLHNDEHAKIEIADGVNTFHIAAYFQGKADDAKERARDISMRWGEDRDDVRELLTQGDYYAAVADCLSETAEQPKEKAPETGIKFYWNGIKVNGSRLIKCGYFLDENRVRIYAKDYGAQLPHEYFSVENDTDIMTDYFDTDSADLTPEHPLYKFARYAALKGIASGHSYRKLTEGQALEWGHTKDPGQPTASDLAAVAELKTAAESARIAAEHAAQLEAREQGLRKISEGRNYIESVASAHPVMPEQPTVEIGFSESPYLYSLSHGVENVFSVAAAEIILKHYDELHHAEDCGYEKTGFIIRWKDEETGEENTYEGRYDLGDNDGGMIEHIRSLGRWYRTHDEHTGKEIPEPPQELSENERFADWLETFKDGGRVVKVDIAPGVVDLLALRKKKQQQAEESERKTMEELLDSVAMLTDFQLEAAVMMVDPQDKEKIDVARFFLQELARRDEKKAIEVLKKWREQSA